MARRTTAFVLLSLLVSITLVSGLWGGKKADAEAAAPSEKFFWHNEVSGESRWELPETEHKSEDGIPYYVDPVTKESVWEKPAAMAWKAVTNEDGTYYYNDVTSESTWEKPEALAWVKVATDDDAEL